MEAQLKVQNEFIVWFTVLGVIFLMLMVYLYHAKKQPNPFKKQLSSMSAFIIFAAIAFLIRIAIAYSLPGYMTDMDCFKAWSNYAYEGGLANFYTGDFFADYPPLYVYALSFLGFLRDAFSIDINSQMFSMMIRLPAMICDIVAAYAVYRIARQKLDSRMALFLSMFLLLNPAVIFNSSAWGQVDILVTMMMVLTVWLMVKDKLVFASAVFMLAFLLKPQAIMIAPLLAYVLIRNIVCNENKRKGMITLLVSLGVMAGLFFLVPLPFGVDQEPLWMVNRMLGTIGQYPQVTLNAFNLYGMLGVNFVDASSLVFLGLGANVWGFILIAVVCLYALWMYLKNPKKEFLFAIAAFIIMGVFAFGHGMHERYLFPVPILLLFAYILIQDRRLVLCTVLTFMALLLNQSLTLYYYQIVIPQGWVIAVSALNMAIFGLVGYVITQIARGRVKYKSAKSEEVREPIQKCPEQMRLDGFAEKKLRMTRKDTWVMVLITVIYAVVAFTNLGAFKIPETATVLDEPVTIEFSQQEQISQIKYYAGYGEEKFDIQYSQDGSTFYPVSLKKGAEEQTTIEHQFKNMYRWQVYDTNIHAKYLKFAPLDQGELPVLEIAVKNADGAWIAPENVISNSPDAQNLFDEQVLIPEESTYMTDFYFDEIYHVRTAYENIHQLQPYEITHPPLGKLILSLGIQMFGMNPFGWRFMGTLTGVLMLPIIYLFGKMLFKKTKYAAFATILLAADFMHFAQTRIGTIDSYSILWIMLMYFFMFRFTQVNFNKQKLSKTIIPLFLSGLFFGIGAATKWLCIYAGAGLLVIFLITMWKRSREYRFAKQSRAPDYEGIVKTYKYNVAIILASCVFFFLLIPIVIYLLSYIPYTQVTTGTAYEWIREGDLKYHYSVLGNQFYMLNYHSTLDPATVHPFSSMWYSWPADVRPVLFFNGHNDVTGTVSTLSTMGNPLLWWSGVVACVWLIVDSAKGKHRSWGITFLAIAALSQFMPWWFVSREVFIYHYFATVPFLILLIVYWLRNVERDFKYGKQFGWIFIAACIGMFIAFYPVITGIPANPDYLAALRWMPTWPFYG